MEGMVRVHAGVTCTEQKTVMLVFSLGTGAQAYMWLRVRILLGRLRRALAGSLRWAVKWDVAVLSALLSGLVTVLWRIWQRRRRHRQGGYPP